MFSLVHLRHLPQQEMAPGKNLQNELIHSKELPLSTSTVRVDVTPDVTELPVMNIVFHVFPLQISSVAISIQEVFISTFCICFTVWDSPKWFQIIEAGIKNLIHSFFRSLSANFSNSQNGTNCSVSHTGLKWKSDKENLSLLEKAEYILLSLKKVLSSTNFYYTHNDFLLQKSQAMSPISIKICSFQFCFDYVS